LLGGVQIAFDPFLAHPGSEPLGKLQSIHYFKLGFEGYFCTIILLLKPSLTS
jgi:hypothetical protein